MRFLAVKNFEEYQHYSDRTPPWIKLYNSLLDDYAFLRLSEPSQIHLIKLWLLASRHDNRIPNDLAYISGKLLPKSAIDLDELIVAGFLSFTDEPAKRRAKKKSRKPRKDRGLQRKHVASTVIAKSSTNARLEGETEREGETEEKSKIKSISAAPSNWVAAAVEIFSAVGSFDHGHVGKHLKSVVRRYGWPETERGLRDYVSAPQNGHRRTPAYFAQESGTWVVGAREGLVDDAGIPTARANRLMGVRG